MELTLQLPQGPQRVAVTGPAERNLKIIRESLDVRITAREASLKLSGESRASLFFMVRLLLVSRRALKVAAPAAPRLSRSRRTARRPRPHGLRRAAPG